VLVEALLPKGKAKGALKNRLGIGANNIDAPN
jgi:hypothetical protein